MEYKHKFDWLDVVGIVFMILLGAASLTGVGFQKPDEAIKAISELGYRNPRIEEASPIDCPRKISRHKFVAISNDNKNAEVRGLVCCGITKGSCLVTVYGNEKQ